MDPLHSWWCDLGSQGCHEGKIPSSILNFCGMYVICIEDNALFKGEGDVIPQLLSPRIMILHVTYVLLHYGLMIFLMELLSFAWLMWLRNYNYCLITWLWTLVTIINVNVITSIFAIFECCYYWLNKQLAQKRKLKEYGGPWIPQSEGEWGHPLHLITCRWLKFVHPNSY